MPWIEVDEPFAAPPRSCGPLAPPDDANVDLGDRWGTIHGAEIEGPLDIGGCERLEIRGSVLRGTTLETAGRCEIDVDTSELVDCDLSTLRLRSLSSTRLEGCKLTGSDMSAATVRDVEMVNCLLRLVDLRMAELERVVFSGCTIADADLFDARLGDVSFPESTLGCVDVERARHHHVDLRSAAAVDLRSCGRLDGCLITAGQAIELAYALALASGASVQRAPDG